MTQTETAVQQETAVQNRWVSGAVGGLVGGIIFGLVIQFVMDIMPVIGALYGLESLAVGWIAHLFHSVVFGLVYAAVVGTPRLSQYASKESTGAALGAAYGVVLWFVAAGLVMPVWMDAMGLSAPSIPNLGVMSLAGHLVYGVLLGAIFAAMMHRR